MAGRYGGWVRQVWLGTAGVASTAGGDGTADGDGWPSCVRVQSNISRGWAV